LERKIKWGVGAELLEGDMDAVEPRLNTGGRMERIEIYFHTFITSRLDVGVSFILRLVLVLDK
jgi:hypothetical protein